MDWKYGTDESRSTLNGINQLGYTESQLNHDLAKNIWNEQIGVKYADIDGHGLYKVGEKSITLKKVQSWPRYLHTKEHICMEIELKELPIYRELQPIRNCWTNSILQEIKPLLVRLWQD